MNLAIGGAAFFALILFGWVVYRGIRKNALLDAQLEQRERDQKLNRQANEEYRENVKQIEEKIPDTVDPSDPWAGV